MQYLSFLIYLQLKDFHLSDDEKEIGTYAGWISKV